MIEAFGSRQQELLRALLDHKGGLTIDELAQRLGITRNAVRQHLTGLERDRLVESPGTRPSGGRPQRLYALSDAGRELFPRHYAWFAELLIESMRQEAEPVPLGDRLEALGRRIGGQLRDADAPAAAVAGRVGRLVDRMAGLGYRARAVPPGGGAPDALPDVEAGNCIFHHLAARYPEVCRFDLGLMAAYAGAAVDHRECMVRGGACCRFRFEPAAADAAPGPGGAVDRG